MQTINRVLKTIIIFFYLLILNSVNLRLIQAEELPQGTVINLNDYLAPGNPPVSVSISSGETFTTMMGSDGSYLQCKNSDCSSFQKIIPTGTGFGIQGENYWLGYTDRTFQYRQGSFNPSSSMSLAELDAQHPVADWLPLQMEVGGTYTTVELSVVGFSLNGQNITGIADMPNTGPSGKMVLKLEYVIDDVAKIVVVSGPGAGEVFYYKKGVGWVGWNGNVMTGEEFPYEGVGPTTSGPQGNTVCAIYGNNGSPKDYIPPPDKYPFRPKPCKNCSTNVELPTRACAISPVVVQWQRIDCSTPTCPSNDDVFQVDWHEVTFNLLTRGSGPADDAEPAAIDASKVPFAGYREACRQNPEMREENPLLCTILNESYKPGDETFRASNPNDYINDYWEGTALFDERDFDMSNIQDTTDIFWEYGVFRKLAAAELQDDFRKKMIVERGFNYVVDAYVWDIDDTGKKSNPHKIVPPHKMQEWAKPNPCPYAGDINACKFPPDPKGKTTEEYARLMHEWLKTEWGQLWYHIPLFSREDAPGKAILKIAHTPGTIDKGKSQTSIDIPLAIPHLTRLYESTNALYSLLTPTMKDAMDQQTYLPRFDQNQTSNQPENTPLLLAQAAVSDISEPKLLAQAGEINNQCDGVYIVRNPDGTYGMRENNEIPGANCYYRDVNFQISYTTADGQSRTCDWIRDDKLNQFSNPDNTGPTYWFVGLPNCNIPSNATSVSVTLGQSTDRMGGDECQGIPKHPTCTCTTTTSADGKVVTTCVNGATEQPAEPPCPNCTNCENNDPACVGNSPISDIHPNDAVCCDNQAIADAEKYNVYAPGLAACCADPLMMGMCSEDVAMGRNIEVKLDIPYLEDVYQKTAGPNMAIFNLFKSATFSAYPDYDALSSLMYEVIGPKSYTDRYKENPQAPNVYDDVKVNTTFTGELYFPYLGGIHQAKKCVSEQALIPTALLPTYNQCHFWGGSLLNNTGISAESTADE